MVSSSAVCPRLAKVTRWYSTPGLFVAVGLTGGNPSLAEMMQRGVILLRCYVDVDGHVHVNSVLIR